MTNRYVNIVHVVVNEHGPIFADLIALLTDSLEQGGYQVSHSTNKLINDSLNIIVGHTFVLKREDFTAIRNAGAPYIVLQMEALDELDGFKQQIPDYMDFLKSCRQVWDYSPTNVKYLKERGCLDVRKIPIGYSSRLERIAHAEAKDIDVFFYGSMTARRQHILEQFKDRGAQVYGVFRAYGPERDKMIARSKIVLNIHQFDLPHLEEVRIAYLLNNRCFVLSETSDYNPYGEGVVYCKYDDIVDCGLSYLQPNMQIERTRIAEAGYSAIKDIPTTESMRSALEDYFGTPPSPTT